MLILGLYIIFFAAIFSFGYVLLFGAPYLPTRGKESKVALDMLALKPGQKLYELGCGDGKILLEAQKRKLLVVGYELNPVLYLICIFRTRKFRENITVKFGNFWRADLSDADGIYVFLLDKFMSRLDKKLSKESKPGTKLASYNFKIRGRKYRQQKDSVYLYIY